MAPAARKRATRTARQPLAVATAAPEDQTQVLPKLIEIFNNSQHVTSSDMALNQLKKLYKNTEFRNFEGPLRNCVKKLFQSKQSIYFKTSCEFLCKFLQHVSKLSDEIKTKQREGNDTVVENTAPGRKTGRQRSTRSSLTTELPTAPNAAGSKRGRQVASKRGTKRKADVSDDELLGEFLSTTDTTMQTDSTTDDETTIIEAAAKRRSIPTDELESAPITDHDRVISSCIDVADHYMQVADEDLRFNAVFFVCKFLFYVESLDEEICNALKSTLPKRIRDKKPIIRAQAVLASRTFQDNKMTQDAFRHHFYKDPELVVRKALLQCMDTKIFGYDFLVDSSQDTHELMRKSAFQRLGKMSPKDLNQSQLHRVIHNGLNERERQASYAFKTHTLEPWLSTLYVGLDFYKFLESFDILNHHEDIERLLESVYERDLDKLESNGTLTKLHHVVESFRERWLDSDGKCLPQLNQIDERVITVWLTLVKFCKSNQSVIKSVKVRTVQQQSDDANESIERILDSQQRDDDVAELYERLTPDLVNLVDFLKRLVHHSDQAIKRKETDSAKLEYIYHQIMQFISTYEVGDELERKTVQEVFGNILKENLLTGKFNNFIPPIIKCLFKLIYSSSSNLMINYISELINNVRSHLEDLISPTQPQLAPLSHSTIAAPRKVPKSAKKVKINTKRNSYAPDMDNQNLEFKIANIRVELEELKDKLDFCIKEKDFDQAKTINNKMGDLQAELTLLHGRRCSIASDVSHMSLIVEAEATGDAKLSSTMIGDTSMTDENDTSNQSKDVVKVFKHHSNELLKCLQMYFGCLQSVNISEIPQTMLNHLMHLSYECLDEWFKDDSRVRTLMVACNGLSALIDNNFAKHPTTITLLISACFDPSSIEIRTVGFKSLVDMVCQHNDIEIPMDKAERFLKASLRDYGKFNPIDIKKNEFEFITAIVEGATKLLYFKKISSPEILSHLIIWWYHPRTHSKLKQFIGVFLPTFVDDVSKKQSSSEDTWLKDLLEDTFVISIEYLHDYILGPGFNIMAASDMLSLINFLCNLIPLSYHQNLLEKVDSRIEELSDSSPDLLKYLKQSKNILTPSVQAHNVQTTLAHPLQTVN